ncbi:phage distal tail protein [Microbispora sp. ATCC PTA-5024]|uniref:phage distal tail protein n=1 Tax=Microbispora sp. ATCC PTA-5024 TaxID=316330 RepID=UPI0003DC0788|nr:phage tail domain-containing protein [Microbispora sp. ATCC PTA-5024]ETK36116.1 hypothetical protein MPTA5024_10855 [Microbispora sp. ATCC PTA-5024]
MLKKNSFSGGTDGANITTSNSGGTSGNAFDSWGSAPSYTSSQATGLRAPLVAKLHDLTSSSDSLIWNYTLSARTVWLREYLYLSASPASDSVIVDESEFAVWITLKTDRTVTITSTGFTPVTFVASTTALPLNTWCRIEAKIVYGTTSSNGAVELRIYTSADSSTATETKTATGVNTGTTVGSSIAFDAVYGFDLLVDDLAITDVDWLGPAAINATATPSAVPASTSAPTPTISTGQSPSPAAVASVAAVPAPAVSTGQTTNATTVAAVSAVPTPTITVGTVSSVQATAVPAVASVAAPGLSTGSIIAPGAVAAAGVVPAQGVSAGSIFTASAVPAVAHVPLAVVTVPILPGDLVVLPGQVEYDGTLWGEGTSFRVNEITGWTSLPTIDNGNTLRPQRHGAWSGRKLAQQRLVTIKMQALAGTDPSTVDSLLDELAAAASVPDDESERNLVIRGWGPKRIARGAVVDFVSSMDDDYSVGMPTVSVLIACSDARKYGLTVTSVVVDNGSTAAAVNEGNTSTHPLVRINGPCTNPSITNQTTDRILSFGVTLASNETLLVDTNAGTAVIGAADYMHTLAPLSVPPEDWYLVKGTNAISYSASSGGANGVELQFQPAYLA